MGRGGWPWAVGAAAALFYLSTHSSFYNFDGIACAIAVELGDFRHLAHGNHLAYGVIGWVFYKLWTALGYSGPALLSLQVLDSLLGGAGVGLFFSWLRRLDFSRGLALAASLALAFSFAYWFWSLEAQVYLLGVFFLLLAARELASENPHPVRLGLLHAGAVLGHVGHVMFAPAACYALARNRLTAARRILRYLAVLGGVVAVAYLLAGAFLIRPRSWEDVRIWLLGSAALTMDKSFHWHGGYDWDNLRAWAAMTLRIFSDPAEGSAASYANRALSVSALALAALALPGLRKSGERRRWIVIALLWLSGYGLLFACWEPYTMVYRISDLAPLWLMAALGLERRPRLAVGLLAAWAAAALAVNGLTAVRPRADPARNADLSRALWLRELTPENAWLTAVGAEEVYLPYFAHRRTLNLRYFTGRPEALESRLEERRLRGEPVVAAGRALEGEWSGFFGRRFLREMGRRDGRVAYEVGPLRPGAGD